MIESQNVKIHFSLSILSNFELREACFVADVLHLGSITCVCRLRLKCTLMCQQFVENMSPTEQWREIRREDLFLTESSDNLGALCCDCKAKFSAVWSMPVHSSMCAQTGHRWFKVTALHVAGDGKSPWSSPCLPLNAAQTYGRYAASL